MIIKGKVIDCVAKNGISAIVTMINSKTQEKKEITTNPDGTYEVIVDAGNTYAFTVSSPGHTLASKSVATTKKDAETERVIDFELCPPIVGDTFTLRNIYFDFDKFGLRNKSVEDLNQLVKVMKENPTMTIELGGHTDTRGDTDYNQKLSENRAKIAKDYLIKKGIDASRIQSRGFGELQTEISDAEISKLKGRKAKNGAHQQNRRTIVTVLTK